MSEYTTREIVDMIEANGGPEGLDLSDKDLSGINLSREAIQMEPDKIAAGGRQEEPCWWSHDSQGIRLVDIKLAATNLSEANLEGADLEGARLVGTKLQKANLSGANLQEAMVYETHLEGARLCGANLRGVSPWSTGCIRADLLCYTPMGLGVAHPHIEGADLAGADLRGSNLAGADLRNADLSEADLRDSDLGMANLLEAELEGANLGRTHCQGAEVTAEQLSQAASLHGAVLPDGTKLSDSAWEAEFRAWRRRRDRPQLMPLLPKP